MLGIGFTAAPGWITEPLSPERKRWRLQEPARLSMAVAIAMFLAGLIAMLR